MSRSDTKSADRTIGQRLSTALLGPAFHSYLWLVSKTSHFTVEGREQLRRIEMLGYWHGDSPAMMVLLIKLKKELPPVDVVITADWRGDIVEKVLQKCGANALRTKDGIGVRKNMRQLIDVSGQKNRIFVLAMDGPLGPRHVPKKLLPYLAGKAGEEVYAASFYTRRAIRLKNRWDKYEVPLPFNTFHVQIENGVPMTNTTLQKADAAQRECGTIKA